MNNADDYSKVTVTPAAWWVQAHGGGVSLAKPPGYQLDALRRACRQAHAAGNDAQAEYFDARYGRLALEVSLDEFVAHIARMR